MISVGLLLLTLASPVVAGDLTALKDARLAAVLAWGHELGAPTPSNTNFYIRIYESRSAELECGGTVASCPDVHLYISVVSGALGDAPIAYELPAEKGWKFVRWLPSASDAAAFVVSSAIPSSNVEAEAVAEWRPREYTVKVSANCVTYQSVVLTKDEPGRER
jgi:hypothetical protein